jgi:hypothetical protein
MKKILLLLILSSSIILSAKNVSKIKDVNFKSRNETVKNSVKTSKLTKNEELELFGYEVARILESRNDISKEEKMEIKFELGLPMTE